MTVHGWPWIVVWVNAKAAISPVDKERLMRAFDTLGPERVALGLTATGHGWGDCFLSHATGGQPYGLRPTLLKGWRTNRAPGLSENMTQVVVRVWDRKERAFRELARQWLDSQFLHAAESSVDRYEPALSAQTG